MPALVLLSDRAGICGPPAAVRPAARSCAIRAALCRVVVGAVVLAAYESAAACGQTVDLDVVDDAVREVAWAPLLARRLVRALRLAAVALGAALIVLNADRLPALGRTVISAAASALNVVPLVDVAALDIARAWPRWRRLGGRTVARLGLVVSMPARAEGGDVDPVRA